MAVSFAADSATHGRGWEYLCAAAAWTVVPALLTDGSASTLVVTPRAVDWRLPILRRLLDLMSDRIFVHPQAVVGLLSWIRDLPANMPAPAAAIGDDGSISIEWDAKGVSLHLTFHGGGEEAYFVSDDGDEWEASQVIGMKKVDDAIGRLAGTGLGRSQ